MRTKPKGKMMKKAVLFGVICGLIASCVKNDGFVYQNSIQNDTITVSAKSGYLDSKNKNIIILEKPCIVVMRQENNKTMTDKYSAKNGQLNIKANELVLSDSVRGYSANGDTITANKLNMKL